MLARNFTVFTMELTTVTFSIRSLACSVVGHLRSMFNKGLSFNNFSQQFAKVAVHLQRYNDCFAVNAL